MKIKTLSLLAVAVCYVNQVQATSCKLTSLYQAYGWVVHDANSFQNIAQDVTKRLERGLNDQSIVKDISGPMAGTDTPDGQVLELMGYMYDDLKTPHDLMYGDIALIKKANDNTLVEIRWFDGKARNIVLNPTFLKCFTEVPPIAENSVL